jgi:assimilatory nitrate reductase catalytic subunit
MPQVATHCPYCALQCGMSLDGDRVAPREFPVNAGRLCQKGWTSGTLLTSPARLTTPLVRVGGELVPATWDDALDLVARRLLALRQEHGRIRSRCSVVAG